MWRIERGPHPVGPFRWEWTAMSTAHGAVFGYAWTYGQAERRLAKAERSLYEQ